MAHYEYGLMREMVNIAERNSTMAMDVTLQQLITLGQRIELCCNMLAYADDQMDQLDKISTLKLQLDPYGDWYEKHGKDIKIVQNQIAAISHIRQQLQIQLSAITKSLYA